MRINLHETSSQEDPSDSVQILEIHGGLDRFFELKSLALKKQQAKCGTIAEEVKRRSCVLENHASRSDVPTWPHLQNKRMVRGSAWDCSVGQANLADQEQLEREQRVFRPESLAL